MTPEMTANNPVRVSIPVSVASEIGSLKKAVATILDKLGCPACCSGHDLFFELQRDVIFNKNLKAKPEVSFRAANAIKSDPTRRVALQPEFAANIDNVFSAIDKLAELSGHPACATGCDMRFELERQFVIDLAGTATENLAGFG